MDGWAQTNVKLHFFVKMGGGEGQKVMTVLLWTAPKILLKIKENFTSTSDGRPLLMAH